MRFALAVEGTRGDVHPMLDLGQALRAHGHAVVVCAPPDFADEAALRGLEFRPVGDSVRAQLDESAAALMGGGASVLRTASRWFQRALERQFDALPAATRGTDFVVGAGITLAGGSVAELHGVPYRYLVYCPGLLPSREHPPITWPTTGSSPWRNALLWTLHRGLMKALLGRPLGKRRRALGLGPRDFEACLLGDRPLLACDPVLAAAPVDCPLPVRAIGCLHRGDRAELPPKLEAFLSEGPAPVYIGFGSMTDPDPERTTRTILDSVAQLGVRALLSQGWAELGGGALPGDVMRVGSVAHATLLPRVAAAVHHGGAGTVTSAARAGVPQVVVAHAADQFYWGRRVYELGLGPPHLARKRLDARKLADALSLVLDNEVVSERAQDIAQQLADAPHPLDVDPASWLTGD